MAGRDMDGTMDKDGIVDSLNDLIRIVEDSHEAYRHAAGHSPDEDLKALFNDLAAQRGAIVRELQRLVAGIGGAPGIGGTVMGGAHRFLLDIREAVLGRDRGAILAEVERAESACVDRYESALAAELPANVASALGEQADRIRTDRDRVAALKQAVA